MMKLSQFDEQLCETDDPLTALKAVLLQGPAALAVLAADGSPVAHNPALVELLGPEPMAFLQLAHEGSGAGQDPGGVLQRVRQGETVRIPPRWVAEQRAGGRSARRAVEQTLFPLRDRAGRIIYAGVFCEDVTARLERDELRAQVALLEKQNQRLRAATRHKSEFLASMSHELRTPLNGIMGFAQLLHDGQVEHGAPEHGEFLSHILANSEHLLHLLNEVLDIATIEAGKLPLRPEPVSVAALVAEVCSSLRGMSAGKHIQTQCEVSADLGDVVLDPARFKQVLYNYVSNAVKFTPQGGRVSLRVTPEHAKALRIEVEDTGVGISLADMPRLFMEFEQAGGELPRKERGTGLGLALTRRIVEAQGGKVGVRSVIQRGSVFYAILPRRPEYASPGTPSDRDPLAPFVLGSAMDSMEE